MVNCGVRMVNCRARVTKHAQRKIAFFTGARARPFASLVKESRVKSYMQIISSPPWLTCRLCYWRRVQNLRLVYILYIVFVTFLAQAGASAYIIVLERERMYVRSPATVSSLSLFLSSRTDFNANERCRCANVKGGCGEGEREYLKSRLMIRDDMRHSSLSDVWLDCRYCSLSFIFCELATDARVHASECA